MQYDENLWFFHEGCEGKHYFIGNPHTFPGRMWAWCPHFNRTFFVSKPAIGELSEPAKYWVKGFLAGNQPAPPADENENVIFDSPEYAMWQQKVANFEATGIWDSTDSE